MAAALPRLSVQTVTRIAKRVINPGFSAWRLNSDNFPRLDPFLAVDWFEMSQPTFPPHPHAGFSAVTMLFEDSEGRFVNRDSRGDRSVIKPGDVHWTCAGSGVVHEEIPEVPGVMGRGLQIFVNLAPEHKLEEPRIHKLHAADIPTFSTAGGGRVRVVAGEAGGVAGNVDGSLLTKVTLLDITLPHGASYSHPVPAGHNAVALVLAGSVTFGAAGTDGADTVLGESVCEFGGDGGSLEATGSGSGQDGPARLVLFSGKPIGAPVVWRGPFCGNSEAQVEAFVEAYRSGRMGALSASPGFS